MGSLHEEIYGILNSMILTHFFILAVGTNHLSLSKLLKINSKSIPSKGQTMYPTFPYCGAGTNPPPLYNTMFEHQQSQNQNQILHSNNLIWSSTIPRNEPTTEAVASVPIVGEGSSGKRANQRHRNKNARELLNDAQKKLKRKMKNRESATRSRERKKVWCNILIVTLHGMLSLWDYLYGEQSMVVQASIL